MSNITKIKDKETGVIYPIEDSEAREDISELKSAIASSAGLTADIKQALMDFARAVAFKGNDPLGQTYIDALEDALYPPADLSSISAVYTQSGTVYDTDALDSLKSDLVVTAHYSDSTTETVTSYALSGTLAEGTSAITVTYGGKTTTFNVTVTPAPSYVTDGLIHHWDAIDNTGNGHDSSSTTWADLVGGNDFTINGSSITWSDNGINFAGTTGHRLVSANNADPCANKTVEVVFTPAQAQSSTVMTAFNNHDGADNQLSDAYGKVNIYSDNTVNGKGVSSACYPTGLSAMTDIKSITVSYSSNTAISALYVNGDAKTVGSTTHSLKGASGKITAGACPTNYDYAFNGVIHAIRIYNRILTAEEVASNYAVDTAKYGLE